MTALKNAYVAIMDDEPHITSYLIMLSQRATGILKHNIDLALGIKAVSLVFVWATL